MQFDRETQQAYKSQAYVKFGETLYMDRFMDSGDPDKRARSKEIQLRLNVLRDRIQRLTQGKVRSSLCYYLTCPYCLEACSVCSWSGWRGRIPVKTQSFRAS